MSLKPSSRFAAKGTKKAQAQRTDSLTDNDDIIIKQPWTLKREDLAVDIPDYSKECAEPLVIRKNPLIAWFDNICYYNGNTLEKRTETMQQMLSVFWETDPNHFLDKCKDDESREKLKQSKLELMCILDGVLRMMTTTLIVRYIAYNPLDMFYAFLCDLFDNEIINWNTVYCLTHIKYSIESASIEHTYAKRWCDTCAQYRTKQWKLFVTMCYRPSHSETFGALANLIPPFRLKRIQFLPHQSMEFKVQPHIMGVLIQQTANFLKRAEMKSNERKVPYNFLVQMLVDYQNHLSQVARLLKGYVESVSEEGQTPDFLFAYPLVDAKSDPEMYFTFFAAIKGFPFVVEEDGQRTPSSTRFPLVDEFRKASIAFLDKMHRYELFFYNQFIIAVLSRASVYVIDEYSLY